MTSSDGAAVLVNASPDVLRQIEATPALHPRAPRHTPIAAVVLTNGDLDHVLGLFSLRESQPLSIYATESVRRGLLDNNAICRTLHRFAGQTVWRRLDLDRDVALLGPAGEPTGLQVSATAVPGKLPVHLEGGVTSDEDNVALRIQDARGSALVYMTSSARVDERVRAFLDGADALLFDGSFWSSDELIRLGLSSARAEDMAHIPIGGPEGSLALLSSCTARRKIYSHINNTNPILVAGSDERRLVEEAGWEIAEDGMEISL